MSATIGTGSTGSAAENATGMTGATGSTAASMTDGRLDGRGKAWTVRVDYATDRAVGASSGRIATFGGTRGRLSYGEATVLVPYRHQVGRVEEPSVWRLQFSPVVGRDFVVDRVASLPLAKWETEVRAQVAADPRGGLLLFVHGYNVSFDDALKRTAQIRFDTKFAGPAILFSWPAHGGYSNYPSDEDGVRWATPHLVDVMRRLLATSGARQIHLIAHSMGNRALTDMLVEIGRDDPAVRSRIREVVLAAPDIDAAYFRSWLAPRILKVARRVTLYTSDKDWALAVSNAFHSDQRAGQTKPTILIDPPIETIDVSNLSADMFGHSYIDENPAILNDLRTMFRFHNGPSERGMMPVGGGRSVYWRFPDR